MSPPTSDLAKQGIDVRWRAFARFIRPIAGAVFFLVGLPGIPEDLVKWRMLLAGVRDYFGRVTLWESAFLSIGLGLLITAIPYRIWRHLLQRFWHGKPDPQMSWDWLIRMAQAELRNGTAVIVTKLSADFTGLNAVRAHILFKLQIINCLVWPITLDPRVDGRISCGGLRCSDIPELIETSRPLTIDHASGLEILVRQWVLPDVVDSLRARTSLEIEFDLTDVRIYAMIGGDLGGPARRHPLYMERHYLRIPLGTLPAAQPEREFLVLRHSLPDGRRFLTYRSKEYEFLEGAYEFYMGLPAYDQERIHSSLAHRFWSGSKWSRSDLVKIVDEKEATRSDLNELLLKGKALMDEFVLLREVTMPGIGDLADIVKMPVPSSISGAYEQYMALQRATSSLTEWVTAVRSCLKKRRPHAEGLFLGCPPTASVAVRLKCHLERLEQIYRDV